MEVTSVEVTRDAIAGDTRDSRCDRRALLNDEAKAAGPPATVYVGLTGVAASWVQRLVWRRSGAVSASSFFRTSNSTGLVMW
jgi:hypothetical protein